MSCIKMVFAFYSDQSGVSYSTLNTIAMKYVMIFRCRDFFIDEKVLLETEISPFITYMNEEDAVDKKKKENSTIDQSHFVRLKNQKKTIIVDEQKRINRFISLGKIANFEIRKIPKKKSFMVIEMKRSGF